MNILRFEDIIAWQKSKELTIQLHNVFLNVKDYSFKDQIFRASLSIMNNIAEGFDRGTDKELKHFLHIARGSTAEVRSMVILVLELGYIKHDQQKHLLQLTDEISKLTSGFIKSLD